MWSPTHNGVWDFPRKKGIKSRRSLSQFTHLKTPNINSVFFFFIFVIYYYYSPLHYPNNLINPLPSPNFCPWSLAFPFTLIIFKNLLYSSSLHSLFFFFLFSFFLFHLLLIPIPTLFLPPNASHHITYSFLNIINHLHNQLHHTHASI